MYSVSEFIKDQFTALVNNGGKKVSEEHGNARVDVCRKCPYFGKVVPDILVGEMDGCTICKCPSKTKPFMSHYWRKKGVDKDKPLTPVEVLEASTKRHLFPDKYELVELKCPHPEGNKWEVIDEKYKV